MKKIYMSLMLSFGVLAGFSQDLIITGVMDGPLSGGLPKAIEIYVVNDIADLSLYGIGSATNGGASSGSDFEFTGSTTAGSFIYVGSESTGFNSYFGFNPDFITGTANINGDDALELFYDETGAFTGSSEVVIDVFGVIGCDPNSVGTACPEWEYLDGWAYRNNSTGPEGSTFTLANWTFSGANANDACSTLTNATCGSVFPIGTYTAGGVPSTKVSFSEASFTVNEDDGTYDIVFSITNASATVATTFDVELTDGLASDLGDYTTQTVTFAAGSPEDQLITITISDNELLTGNYSFTFSITNVGGGESAGAGSPATFVLSVNDDEKLDLLVLNVPEDCDTFYGVDVTLNQDQDSWTCTGGSYVANAFVSGGATETEVWLVSQPYNFEEAAIVAFEYSTISGFDDQANLPMLMVSTDYDGAGGVGNATWTPIKSIDNDDGVDVFVDVSVELAGEAYAVFAVKYADVGGSDAEAATLYDVEILADSDLGTIAVWTGELDADWGTSDNWSAGVVPDDTDFIYISDGAAFDPIVDGDYAVDYLHIADGMTIEVLSGSSLAIFGEVTGDGDMAIMRDVAGNSAYNVIGAPTNNVNIADLEADFAYTYETSTSMFVGASEPMAPGRGYFVAYHGQPLTLTFTGTPNTGQQSAFVSDLGGGFNLVANPYAGHIHMDRLREENAPSVIDGVFYFWEDGGFNDGALRGGDYVTINTEGLAIGGTEIGRAKAEQGTIPPLQGFFVHAGASSNTDMIFYPGMQVSAGEGSETVDAEVEDNFFRKASEEKQLIRLAISGNNLYNEILFSLSANATLGMDLGLDALKFSGNELISFYSLIENERFAIQAIPTLSQESIQLQLGMDIAEVGEYTLNVRELSGIPAEVSITLLDQLTGQSYDLRQSSSIPFSTASAFADKRFKLVLGVAETLAVDKSAVSKLKVYGSQSSLSILFDTKGSQEIGIYNLGGQLLFSEQVDFANNRAVISPSLARNQIYILRVNNEAVKFIINY